MADSKRKPGKSSGDKRTRAAKGAESLSFEGALDQLEATVARLEEGEMPLEQALELFESGVKLSRQCSETLEAAERRIEILVADRDGDAKSEEFEAVPHFDDDDDDEDDEDFED